MFNQLPKETKRALFELSYETKGTCSRCRRNFSYETLSRRTGLGPDCNIFEARKILRAKQKQEEGDEKTTRTET